MAKVKNFKTIFPAVSVPLKDDYSINEEEFRVYLRWIKSFYDQGIQGLVCNGHTGEITGLTRAERKRVVEICAEECGDIMTIISGVNCENTQESIEMAAEAKEAGADGIITTALAYISTNAAVTAGIYGTYLGTEKKWKKENLFNGAMKWDAIAHVASVILISGAIMLVGAIVLNPQGISIKAPAQLAELLVPFLGKAANYVMGIALLGAGFSSLLGNTQRGMVLLSAGFNKDVSLESAIIRWGCVISLAFACIICFAYGGSPTQLIFIANIATSIATPVAGFFIMLIFWKTEVHGGMKPPRILQICMTVSYGFTVVMTISALSNYIPKLIESFS